MRLSEKYNAEAIGLIDVEPGGLPNAGERNRIGKELPGTNRQPGFRLRWALVLQPSGESQSRAAKSAEPQNGRRRPAPPAARFICPNPTRYSII